MPQDLFSVLIQVIQSWQVLAVTGALILYFFLISHAARGHRRPGAPARTRGPGEAKKGPPPVGEPDLETPEGNDLGLTEE
jgi:hypothetical protein